MKNEFQIVWSLTYEPEDSGMHVIFFDSIEESCAFVRGLLSTCNVKAFSVTYYAQN